MYSIGSYINSTNDQITGVTLLSVRVLQIHINTSIYIMCDNGKDLRGHILPSRMTLTFNIIDLQH